MEFINKRWFAATTLDKNAKTFVIHVATLSTAPTIQIYPLRQIQVGLFLTNKALAKIPPKYLDYADVFLFYLAMEQFENIGINEHAIELVEGKKSPYWPI